MALAAVVADYAVLRQEGTERAYSSPLSKEQGKARFMCAGCAPPVFPPKTKFESGTGKLSFWRHFPGAVRIAADRSMGMVREKVCCTRCDGHLGHVFDDGTPPIHLRYCVNGAALTFRIGLMPTFRAARPFLRASCVSYEGRDRRICALA